LITTTCKHTLHYEVCVSSLRSVPNSETSDLKTLAGIALNLSATHAAKTLSYVYELKSSSGSNNGYMSHCLSDCAEEYSEALENLQDSGGALVNGDYDGVDNLVSAAMSDAETCEDGFSDENVYSSPLSERNRYFSELCSNALAITKLLV
jgi:pectinesterase inhibitor-like protein